MPSGAQYWHRQTLATSKRRFAYCSTLAVYICNAETHSIESIISDNEGTITCIAWSPLNDNMLAEANGEKQLFIWDIEQEQIATRITLPANAIMLQWLQTDSNTILALLSTGTSPDVYPSPQARSTLFSSPNVSSSPSPTSPRSSPSLPG